MNPRYINHSNVASLLSWDDALTALRRGHTLPRAEISDSFLGPDTKTLLTRSAYIAGLGYGVKAVTVMDGNTHHALPTTQGAMMAYAHDTGTLRAIIDSALITRIKTVSDSLLGAQLLARPDSRRLLIVGAGVIAESLAEAYAKIFPMIEEVAIWARRTEKAADLVKNIGNKTVKFRVATDLAKECGHADIISAATLAREPILQGQWIRPGTHVDLIGAYKDDMREADDELIGSAQLYVDARASTVEHIGEIKIPLSTGVISEADIRGELYDLVANETASVRKQDDITVFKNGGGAHLDLMIADYIIKTYEAQSQ
ncbi:hypothetical protein N9H37_02970 [Congregibacter sp.]|nr:hypothetical protein [Congregibacter sp.]MDA8962295.1 hypothetical protein [Congregibacter sp.]